MKKHLPVTEIIKQCIEANNFSTSYIQDTFNLSYPVVQRLLAACKEAKVITGETPRTCITMEQYLQNYESIAKILKIFRSF